MVSLEKYFVTFASVMPKRVEKVHELLKTKNELDNILAQKKDESVMVQLKKIIGEVTLFRKAENDKGSLRYNIRKYKKSLIS